MAKGYVTEFRYCSKIALGIKEYGQLDNLIDYELGMARSDRAFIFTDNHDNQRGHGAGGMEITWFNVFTVFIQIKWLQEMSLLTKTLVTINKLLPTLLPKITVSQELWAATCLPIPIKDHLITEDTGRVFQLLFATSCEIGFYFEKNLSDFIIITVRLMWSSMPMAVVLVDGFVNIAGTSWKKWYFISFFSLNLNYKYYF